MHADTCAASSWPGKLLGSGADFLFRGLHQTLIVLALLQAMLNPNSLDPGRFLPYNQQASAGYGLGEPYMRPGGSPCTHIARS